MDKPVCSREGCTNTEFLTPSHSLHQRFLDKDMKDFFVFFAKPSEADDFFKDFTAKECLESNDAWCNFLSTRCWHKAKIDCNNPSFFEVVLFHDPVVSKRFYYVSGCLPACSKT